ncbi:MAG: acyltransferase [Pedobacter sp.]|uniref:acyltransferase family protein n=1 Tax=Pedobacter sp. TaxID=1411316 RepID=UPI0028073466|nr:acyltransferase [Pedobacter sp.]MDQ8004881.1 acyltransferase [Pedobacter sp.]
MKKHIQFLDGLRGLAALYVLIGHARWLLWEGFQHGINVHPNDYSLFEKLQAYFFTIFRFGHNAVLLFFVLSGFVIHLSTHNSAKRLSVDSKFWIKYLKNRIKRLYPAFIFAILLTAALDYIGNNILNFSNYRTGSIYSSFHLNEENTSIATFLGNLLFLMRTYVPIFGSNGATWSLSYEWWFYVIYPFFYYTAKKNIVLATILQIIFFCLSFKFLDWPIQLLRDVFSMMLIWWLGVLLAEVYLRKIKINFTHLSILILIIPFVIYKPSSSYNDILWGLGLVGLLSFFFSLNENNILIKVLIKLKWLGDCSYTIYIIHVPILIFVHSYILEVNNHKLPQHFWFIYPFVASIVLISYLLSMIIEKPFLNKRK